MTTASAPTRLASLGLPVLLASLGTSMANVALPTLTGAFGATFGQVQWVVVAYLAAMTAALVIAGRVGDSVGHGRLLRGGLVLFSLASVAASWAPSIEVLIAARAVQGVGAATMTAMSLALVREVIAPDAIGSAMGFLGSLSAAGTALGPSLGGLLIAHASWRWMFVLNATLGVAAAALAFAVASGDAPRTRAVSLPLLPVALLTNRKLIQGLAANVLVSTAIMATLIVGPFYLTRTLMLGPGAVGLAMSVGPLVAALGGIPAGRMTDRLGARVVIAIGLSAMGAGILLIALLPDTLGVAGYVVPLAVATAGYAAFQAANNTTVVTSAGDTHRGSTAGLLSLSRNVGLIVGASAMGALFAATGMRETFIVAALLALCALIVWQAPA